MFGINRDENGKIHGDVNFENVEKKVAYITPVPGRYRANDNCNAYGKHC